MTPEEVVEARKVFTMAVKISNKYGPLILEEVDNDGGTAVTSAAIMLSAFCSAMGMTLHDAMGLLMSVHKQTSNLEKEL